MYGVVLWSDVSDKKAVIWCEDHGDLAFFGGASASAFDGPALDAGDLVHFEVTENAPMRLAQNPELVAESHAPALAERLRAAMMAAGNTCSKEQSAQEPSNDYDNVVSFPVSCTA